MREGLELVSHILQVRGNDPDWMDDILVVTVFIVVSVFSCTEIVYR